MVLPPGLAVTNTCSAGVEMTKHSVPVESLTSAPAESQSVHGEALWGRPTHLVAASAATKIENVDKPFTALEIAKLVR